MSRADPPLAFKPVMDEQEWCVVEQFVLDAIREAAPSTPYSERELLSAASHFVRWAHLVAGVPQVRAKIFNRRLVDRYCLVGLERWADSGRANVRSQLLRIAEALLEPGQFHPRLRPIGPSSAAAPYTAAQVVELVGWTAIQGTAERCENAAILLALGLGAGLSGGEIGDLKVRDIVVDDGGVLIHVDGARPRTVPVLPRWEPALRRRALGDPDAWSFRPRRKANFANLITNFAHRGYPVDTPVQSQRMRSTWIVHHLELGTPVVPLMTAAGVQSLEALTRYTPFVTGLPADVERHLLMRDTAPDPESQPPL